jgi:hypothetical protein
MQTSVQANPFGLLLDPAGVLAAVERSERLAHLHSRVCRPLDRPLIPKAGAAEAYDREVDEDEDGSEG